MAKAKPENKTKKGNRRSNRTKEFQEASRQNTPALIEQATFLLHTGQPEEALPVANKALKCLNNGMDVAVALRLPVLELLGEIHLELGDAGAARDAFMEAADLDPDGELPEELGGGADKFLWLAQLCEEGGLESMRWFEKGINRLREDVKAEQNDQPDRKSVEQKSKKLAEALCGAAEVYMTDLSWDDRAETNCEAFVTEACLLAPDSPEPLQTLASVRISQARMDDARAALKRSLALWNDLLPDSPSIPDFPTRISLSRLLMEVQMEREALNVLERLVEEDDSSVEAWYLGGWCQNLLAESNNEENITVKVAGKKGSLAHTNLLAGSRDWLQNCLKLYELLEYEDVRLKEHAILLVKAIDEVLGPAEERNGATSDIDDDEWEDELDGSDVEQLDEDQAMEGT